MKFVVSVFVLLVAGPALAFTERLVAKLEVEDGKYAKHATVFFVDSQSFHSNTAHACGRDVAAVTANSPFKYMKARERVKLRIPFVEGDERGFVIVEASLKSRDYFSGTAVFDVEDRQWAELERKRVAPSCVGLSARSSSSSTSDQLVGFPYYSLISELVQGLDKTDRGWNGALALQGRSSLSPIGMVQSSYQAKLSKDRDLKIVPLSDISAAVEAMKTGRRPPSVNSLIDYNFEQETFSLVSGTVLREIVHSRVRVPGVPRDNQVQAVQFALGSAHFRAIDGLTKEMDRDAIWVVSAVNGRPVGSMDDVVSEIAAQSPTQPNTVLQMVIYSPNGRKDTVVLGHKIAETISLARARLVKLLEKGSSVKGNLNQILAGFEQLMQAVALRADPDSASIDGVGGIVAQLKLQLKDESGLPKVGEELNFALTAFNLIEKWNDRNRNRAEQGKKP